MSETRNDHTREQMLAALQAAHERGEIAEPERLPRTVAPDEGPQKITTKVVSEDPDDPTLLHVVRVGMEVNALTGEVIPVELEPTGVKLRRAGTNKDGSPRYARVRRGPVYRDMVPDPGGGKPVPRKARRILRKIPPHRAHRNESQPAGTPNGFEVKVSNAPLRPGEFELTDEMQVGGALCVLVALDESDNPTGLEVDTARRAQLLAAEKTG